MTLARVGIARVPARVTLAGIVAVSFVLRALAAVGHTTVRYFPDEYIYASLGRSIGSDGRPLIRGELAHFPALLEPILAAPLWALAPLGTAYRLVQLENELVMSLAAIPAYLIARELRLTERYSLLCAAFAVAIPDLVYSSFVTADPVAYPLVLGALWAALVALDRPTPRRDVFFLVLAGLATFARVQYVVLFVAFAAAAIAVERRRVLRAHRALAVSVAIAAAGALALGPGRALGYYSSVLHMHVGVSTGKWALTDLFLLALVSGAILVPGAIAGLISPEGRTEKALSFFVAGLGGGLLVEAALYASNGSPRFQERYLFVLLPLVPIAFGVHARRPRSGRWVQMLIAVAIVVALPRLPIGPYAAGLGANDSPFLWAVAHFEERLGTATLSLVAAVAASAAVALGLLPRMRKLSALAVVLALVPVTIVSVGATVDDLATSRRVRDTYLPANPSWVDALHLRNVVAVQTPGAAHWVILNQLFWNKSVTREVVLGDALPSDLFAAAPVRILGDGSLDTASGLVRSPILFQQYGTSATFTGAKEVASANTYAVWKPLSVPRLGVLEIGRYYDGWLAWSGGITVWPDESGVTRGTLSFTLSLPAGASPVDVRIGTQHVHVVAGRDVHITRTLDGRGPQQITFGTRGGTVDEELRQLSVRSTMPIFTALLKPHRTAADR